ncbi:hypothetical protein ONZ45_g11695 [Pleurotus djamor]|nr:hypothetical protein ONZ45_g11695 [Pleurotus djamor]
MDPLALTTSIIEIAFKVKDSIDTLARRRSRAKELANDVLVNLLRLAEFCERNKSALLYTALGPLRDSLDVLKHDLHLIHQRCKAYKPNQGSSTFKRLASTFKLWMDSDEIEEDLVRIKDRTRDSLEFIMLLSCARMEVGIMKLEGILVSYESRCRLQQFDSAFTQGLLNGDPGLGAFDRSPSEVDNVGIRYIRLKAMELIDTISMATLITGVMIASDPSTYNVLPVVQPALHNIMFKMAELQALTSSKDILISELYENTFDLFVMLRLLGIPDISLGILGAVENRLRQTLRLGTHRLRLPRHINEEEEQALDFLEKTLSLRDYYAISHACYQSAACSIRDEDVKRASEYIQFSRSRLERRASPSNYHRQVEECFSYCAEALEVIQPCIASTTPENSITAHAGTLQTQVAVLNCLSFAQARDGDYTSAYYTGMGCMTSLRALSNIDKSRLPVDFNYLPDFMEYLQEEMPTWTSYVRNPEHRTSYIEEYVDDDDTADDSTRLIVWGEAY